MTMMSKANGSPVNMDAVCKAVNPPPNKRTPAIKPSIVAQNIFWNVGASCLPPEVKVSTTKDPESEDVTKKEVTNNIVKIEEKVVNGNCSNKQ